MNLSSFVCSEVNPVGKLDAGNPHVQFDERGWETGLFATAPILDSTACKYIHYDFKSLRRV